MRKILLTTPLSVFLLSLAFFLISIKSDATQAQYLPREDYVPNEVLVKFKEDVSIDSIQEAINWVQGKIITYLGKEISLSQWDPEDLSLKSFRLDPDLFHIKVPESIGTEHAISALNQLPIVEYAEKNWIGHSCETEPDDDPLFKEQWALKNTKQTGGTSDADIDATDAWDIFTGGSDIVVAVIDSGINLIHEDLNANLWVNEDEVPGDCLDNDNNGYVDDIYGYDFKRVDGEPDDEYGHGTKVAGIIGAVGNNGKGVTGINWSIKLMILKIMDEEGNFKTSDAIKAIDYATENGAHLSNNSYSIRKKIPTCLFPPSGLKDAIKRAKKAGKLLVAAAGNKEYNIDVWCHWPASYDLENIISVLATDHDDKMVTKNNWGWGSNWSDESVDLGAPGVKILTTGMDSGYENFKGTSAAAPHVAGVAALIWGKPVKMWWDQVKERIMEGVDVLDTLVGKCVTGGRLNAYGALNELPPDGAPSNLTTTPTGWTVVDLDWQDNSTNEIGFEVQRMKEGETEYSYVNAVKEGNIQFTDWWAAEAGNTNYYRVRAYNLGGSSSWATASAVIPTGPPATPAGLSGYFDASRFCVVLEWGDASNNEEMFRIERRDEYNPAWIQIGITGPNIDYYYDYDIYPNTLYYYRVRASNPDGYSSYSNIAIVYTPWY
ncbi:MAG: S8 family serine peptidase [Candidatus Aminicenantales bacterium]